MRPRLITAENVGRLAPRPARKRASMRPRLITAENAWPDASTPPVCASASMRPRLITAENLVMHPDLIAPGLASMRPRLITAENGVRDRE